MVMLQRAPHMLQCTPPMGHAVTKITKNIYTVIMKQRKIFVLDKCEIKVYKKIILEPRAGR